MTWTHTKRYFLYDQLLTRFGPHWTWANASPEGYPEFCAAFAEVVGSTQRGVNHQVQWAVGLNGGAREWDQGNFRNAVLNMAAAFDAGFINNSYFPNRVIVSAPVDAHA